jgi:hypothetical protein
MSRAKPCWALKGVERSTDRELWLVPLAGDAGEIAALFGVDPARRVDRELSTDELARLAPFMPAGFRPEPDRDDFALANRFAWAPAEITADQRNAAEALRPVWQAIVELARGHDPRELFERAAADRVTVAWLYHDAMFAPPAPTSDPVLADVLRDGSTWLRHASSSDDALRAMLVPPLLPVLAALGHPEAEDLAFALREPEAGPWSWRTLAAFSVRAALGAATTDRALAALLERPGDSGCSRHPEAGARTLEQARRLLAAHGPPRDWPRMRELVHVDADARKRVLGEQLGGEQYGDLSKSLRALGQLRHAAAEPLLVDVLAHCPTYRPRQDAIAALVELGTASARAAVFDWFDEALDGLVARFAMAEVLRWPEGLALLPRWIGPDVDEGLRARTIADLGDAVTWIGSDDARPRPHPDAAATLARLIPEPDTRAWFERKLAEL